MEVAGAECGHRGEKERGKGLRINPNSAAGKLGGPGGLQHPPRSTEGAPTIWKEEPPESEAGAAGTRCPQKTPAHLDPEHPERCPALATSAPPGTAPCHRPRLGKSARPTMSGPWAPAHHTTGQAAPGATSATSAGPKPTCTEGPYGPVAYFLAQHKWRPWPRAGGSHSRGLSVPGGCGRGRAGLLWTPGGKQGTPLSPVLKAVLSTLGLAHSLTSALNLHGHDHPD